MQDDFNITTYTAADHDDLVTLYQLAFPHDPAWNDPKDMIACKLDIDPEGLLVGKMNGQLVASVMAGYDGHRGWINLLAVHPDHRGGDFGQAMVDAAVQLMNDRGAVKVNLQIRGDNTKLKAYYERLGFEAEDRISMGLLTTRGKSFTSS